MGLTRESAEISLIHFERKNNSKSKKKLENKSRKLMLSPSGFDIRIFREFDPGSGLTLAACITHSSRTEYGNIFSGGRVSNA